jgi:hypothetical protein
MNLEKKLEKAMQNLEVDNFAIELEKLKSERDEIYRLLALAHLEMRQSLEYGFNPNTTRSTLISVGHYYPKLKAKMDELEAKLKEKT